MPIRGRAFDWLLREESLGVISEFRSASGTVGQFTGPGEFRQQLFPAQT